MSATGVLLTYERQIVAFANRGMYSEPAPGAAAKPLEELIAAVEIRQPGFTPSAVSIPRDPAAPVSVRAGRGRTVYVDRYTATLLGDGGGRVKAFFRGVENWHRWFSLGGESRTVARAVTGACNLAFLGLILSGMYLWLPPAFRFAAFKTRLFFNPKARSGKARDFNWHHVFGIWSAIPLAVVVGSGVVFSYGWANALVYRSFGEKPPERGVRASSRPTHGARPARGTGEESAVAATPSEGTSTALSLDDLFARADGTAKDWRTITIDLPVGRDSARVEIDTGNGGQPQRRSALMLDTHSGAIIAAQPHSGQTPGRRARSLIRFLHTGEAFGVIGQTIAGLATAASLFMVWTGWALAYRRLIRPLFAQPHR